MPGPEDKGQEEQDAKKFIEEERAKLVEERNALSELSAEIKKELDALKTLRAQSARQLEAWEAAKGQDLRISEYGLEKPGAKPIQTVSERDFYKIEEEEVFMNEEVLINVPKSVEDGSLPVIVVNVNGINQAIIRGKNQWVKRKYVEALGRSSITKYTQEIEDDRRPEVITMRDSTALTYPFSVIKDPNPNGINWLKTILEQQR